MKVAILAGGLGSRLAEETDVRPKPMVEIGGKPILWHIMMSYSHYGFRNFSIALGYKGEIIKKYMIDYCSLNHDLTVSTATGKIKMNRSSIENWTVELIETGMKTQTGGRIKRLAPTLGNETFMLTWGDGVADINLIDLARLNPGMPQAVRDLPGGEQRVIMKPDGMRATIVAGEVLLENGEHSGALPGKLLRRRVPTMA